LLFIPVSWKPQDLQVLKGFPFPQEIPPLLKRNFNADEIFLKKGTGKREQEIGNRK
jgi:hypothetical protein